MHAKKLTQSTLVCWLFKIEVGFFCFVSLVFCYFMDPSCVKRNNGRFYHLRELPCCTLDKLGP